MYEIPHFINEQLETRSWNEKLESFKLESLKLESCAEVRKNRLKLERIERSWKGTTEVGKFFF